MSLFPRPTLSFETGVLKPSPEAYIAAARNIDIEPRHCLFIDDLERNVEGARTIGMDGIHFKGRIKYYEIWNEQNINYSWPPNQVEAFCKLVKVAAKAVKETDPDAKVMLGGVCFLDVDYFEQMFKRGVAEVVDVICWHPYQWEVATCLATSPSFISNIISSLS